ncbi:hypothetical protein [Mycolicibacterium arenosum]|uniref:Uncharacterized protein n=1 Tax=Mycolicibacterium arenosum TaxID=2952157 RepID=A0ABT1MF36_9MYCO|nr:hypothetical protein [Mycolicibacterium sp. CAU 1645]MCP9276387.1 hypothetical protein [Mycolicibacterium sp. CAU 1645]
MDKSTTGWLALILLVVGLVLAPASAVFRKHESAVATTGVLCIVTSAVVFGIGYYWLSE